MSNKTATIPIVTSGNGRLKIFEDVEEYSEEEEELTGSSIVRKSCCCFCEGLRSDYSVPIGGFVRLHVKYQGNPEICWLKNGRIIDDNFLAQHPNLTIIRTETRCDLLIKNARIEDSGEYEVRIESSPNGKCSSSIGRLSVDEHTRITDHSRDIRIIEHLKDDQVRLGGTMQLVCEFESCEQPEVYWYMNDVLIDQRSAKFLMREERSKCLLKLNNFTKSDAGVYTLKLVDSSGFDQSQCSVKFAGGLFAPVFTRGLNEVNVESGQDVVLSVEVKGEPRPKVEWFKNAKKIPDEKIDNCGNSYCLRIRNADSKHIGVYSVTAANESGESKTYARLNVRGQQAKTHQSSSAAPAFYRSFKDYSALRGENVLYEAVVTGSPKPKVRWLLNDRPIRNSRYYYSNVGNRYSLTISNVSMMDGGRITLSAENKHGRSTCSANLHVTDLEGDFDFKPQNYPPCTKICTNRQNRAQSSGFASSDAYETNIRRSRRDDNYQTQSYNNRSTFKPIAFHLRKSSSDRSISSLNSSDILSDDSDLGGERVNTRTITHEKVNHYREYRFKESSDLGRCQPLQRPVEIRFRKQSVPRCRASPIKRFKSLDRHYDSEAETRNRRRTQFIRLSSMPPSMPRTKHARTEPTFGPIDIIVGKPVTHTLVRDEFTLTKNRKGLVISDSEVEVLLPKTRHASTIVKQRVDRAASVSRFELEGQKSVLNVSEPICAGAEIELSVPKSQHSSTVLRNQRAKDEVFMIEQRQRICGQSGFTRIRSPIKIEEEIDVRVQKDKGSHASTIVKETVSQQECYRLRSMKPIPGEHGVLTVDENIEAREVLDVQLPKLERQVCEHSSTVLREQQEQQQTMNVSRKLVIPGDRAHFHVQDKVRYIESEDVVLPKHGQHSATVYKQTRGPMENFDIGTLKSTDDKTTTATISGAELEVKVPKAADHSTTLVCEGTQKVDFGRIRRSSGASSMLYVSDDIEDHRSTVVLDSERKQRFDIALESEFSEIDENLDREFKAKRDHRTTLMADLVQERELAQKISHSTTKIKNVRENLDGIEMVIDRPNDTSELTAQIESQTQPQTIHFPSAEFYEQREHQRAHSELVARIGTQYEVQGDARAREISSICVEPIRQREETVDFRLGTSSSQIVANVEPQLRLIQDKINAMGSASFEMDLSSDAKSNVNVMMRRPELEPSTSAIVVDLCGALSGPSGSVRGVEKYSSELILGERKMQTDNEVELIVDEPKIEKSSSKVLANLSSSLGQQSYVEMKPLPKELSTSTFRMDLNYGGTQQSDVNVNIGEIEVEKSTAGLTAEIDSSLSVLERMKYMRQQQASTCSVQIPFGQQVSSSGVDVKMRTDLRGRSEVVAAVPDTIRDIEQPQRQMSTSKLEIMGHRPVVANVRMTADEKSVSQLKAEISEHASSEVEIRNFGLRHPEVEMVLHPPVRSEESHSFEDRRKFEASEGSSTVIKQIGNLSPDRYFIGDDGPQQNSSSLYMEMGSYEEKRFEYDEGSTVHLVFDVEGITNAKWTKDGCRLNDDRCLTFITQKTAELVIENSSHQDSGVYECCVCDHFNRTRSQLFIVNVSVSRMAETSSISAESTLTRKRTAPIDEELSFVQHLPDRVICEIGEQLRLVVKIKGKATRTLWYHNGFLIKENYMESSDYSQLYDHSMVIPSLDKRYEGIYSVKVESRINSIESYCHVIVNDHNNNQLGYVPEHKMEDLQNTTIQEDYRGFGEQNQNSIMEITTTKRRRPETTITVREGDCNECIFVISETDDGEFVVTETTTDDERDHHQKQQQPLYHR